MKASLVSLIILSYNHEAYIEEAIISAFEQDYENLQIIISDDNSSDGSTGVIKKCIESYKGTHRIQVNFNKQNLGLANHINKVIALSEGEFIVWCGGDDISLPNKVSKLVLPMLSNKNVVGVHSAVTKIDLKGRELGILSNKFGNFKHGDILPIIKEGLDVGSQSHAFRKSVFTYFGDLNQDVTNEGKVMVFREALLGNIVYLKEPLTLYRIGSGVSTYSGNDILKKTFSEPLKIATWRLTSLVQIQRDYEKATQNSTYNDSRVIKDLIVTEIKKAKIRVQIIKYSWNWKMLLTAMCYRNLFKRSFIDFAKRNLPIVVLKRFYK